MVFQRIFQAQDEQIHHFKVHVIVCQKSHVNLKSYFESIIFDRNLKELYELSMRNFFKVQSEKVVHIIILGVHAQDQINIFRSHQKPFSVILSNSLFHTKVNKDLFKESLVVLSVSLRLHGERLLVKI